MKKLPRCLCCLIWSLCLMLLALPASSLAAVQTGVSVPGADLDHDGTKEKLEVAVQEGMFGAPELRVLSADGKELCTLSFEDAYPHPVCAVYLCKVEGQDYLLYFNYEMYQGYGSYSYSLLRLHEGTLMAATHRAVPYDIYGLQPLDVPELLAFREELNTLLTASTLLVRLNIETEQPELYEKGVQGNEPLEYEWLVCEELPEDLYVGNADLETRLKAYSAYAQKMYKEYGDTWR